MERKSYFEIGAFNEVKKDVLKAANSDIVYASTNHFLDVKADSMEDAIAKARKYLPEGTRIEHVNMRFGRPYRRNNIIIDDDDDE